MEREKRKTKKRKTWEMKRLTARRVNIKIRIKKREQSNKKN